jgi:hypothetical protein
MNGITENPTSSLLKNVILAALFIAISVVFGKMLETLPNIELISFSVWMSSYVLDREYSTVVGFLSFLIHSMLSPYGVAPVPLLLSQAVGGALIGFFGGSVIRSKKTKYSSSLPYDRCLAYLGFGLLITFVYDALTNFGGFAAFSENTSTLVAYMIGGLTFSVIHIVSNGIAFMLLTPLVKRAIDQVYAPIKPSQKRNEYVDSKSN